ncbi:MAG: glycerol acyltransferase [Spirochaetes bacterium]|nr:glycerol acyltransferase [Spirochaetota bacterium]
MNTHESAQEQVHKVIDTKALFVEKNPALAAKLPAWVFALIRRISHEQELNEAIAGMSGLNEKDFITEALKRLEVQVLWHGSERLPQDSKYTLCANHPLGGLDGLALMQLISLHTGSFLVTANDLLMSIPQLRGSMAGINKHGGNAAQVQALDDMYASDRAVLVFPAGRTARPRAFRLPDYAWSKSFIKLSRRYQRLIVPVHVSGRNSWRFYGIWVLRSILGIKTNLEMFLLVDELFHKRGRTIHLTIGAAISLPPAGTNADDRKTAEALRCHVEKLGRNPDLHFCLEKSHD